MSWQEIVGFILALVFFWVNVCFLVVTWQMLRDGEFRGESGTTNIIAGAIVHVGSLIPMLLGLWLIVRF